jgi:hypothetical protein
MRLRDWFVLIGTVFAAGLLFTMWSQFCYERGYAAGAEMVAFDA